MSTDAVQAQTPTAAATAWRDWLRDEAPAWIFVFKTVTAAFLALWIGFRFGIDNARSAMLTVLIVAQPQSGLVVAKSFYRVIGTLVGLIVTVLLLHFLAQSRELFVGAVALWIGLCVAGAAYFRGFRSYGFLLAGYTTCLIGFPAAQHPEATYAIALSRASAVLIGIFCAGLVAQIVLPQRLSDAMVKTVRGRFHDFVVFVRRALGGELKRDELQRIHHRFIADILVLETQRDASYFENPEVRVRDERLRLFNAEFMAASTGMHALHQWMERMRREQRRHIVEAMAPLYRGLSAALLRYGRPPATALEAHSVALQLGRLRPRLAHDAHAAIEQVPEADRLDCACAVDLLLRFSAALHDYTEAYGALANPGQRAPRSAPAFVPHTDPLAAALYGARAVLALLAVTVFWIATAWPNGTSAVLVTAVGCALFAQSPAPGIAVRQMGLGYVLGFFTMMAWSLAILPRLDGFPMLVLSLLPFLMLSNRLVAHPRYAGIGAGMNLLFISEAAPDNVIAVNPVASINDGMAQILGLAVAGIAFSILLPAGTTLFRRRNIRRLKRQVAYACTAPMAGLRHKLESRTRDLLIQLLPAPAGAGAEGERLLETALVVLEVADAVIALREALQREGVDALTRRLLRGFGSALARAHEMPSPAHQTAARDALRRADERLQHLLLDPGLNTRETATLREIQRCLYRLGRALDDLETDTAMTSDGEAHAA